MQEPFARGSMLAPPGSSDGEKSRGRIARAQAIVAGRGITAKARARTGLAEEQPEAYKDVTAAVERADSVGLARKAARLRPTGAGRGMAQCVDVGVTPYFYGC